MSERGLIILLGYYQNSYVTYVRMSYLHCAMCVLLALGFRVPLDIGHVLLVSHGILDMCYWLAQGTHMYVTGSSLVIAWLGFVFNLRHNRPV